MHHDEYDCLLGLPTQPFNEKQTAMFVKISLTSKDTFTDAMHDELMDVSMAYAILCSRIELVKMLDKFEKPLLFFIATLCDRPVNAVMWAYTLCKMAEKIGKKVGIPEWTYEFPMGIPTPQSYDKAWEAQKDSNKPLSNWLDDPNNWQ